MEKALDEKRLDAFSRNFASALFAAYPEWRRSAEMFEALDASTHCLLVRIPAPAESRAAYPLLITTDNEDVTIGFDSYHSHFEWPCADNECGNPLAFIADLLCERLKVVSFWQDDKWCGSQTLAAGEELGRARYVSGAANRVEVRSWHGRFSADQALPAVDL